MKGIRLTQLRGVTVEKGTLEGENPRLMLFLLLTLTLSLTHYNIPKEKLSVFILRGK